MAPADATRLVPGPLVIQAYGNGGFRIAGQFHAGSCIVYPERVISWAARSAEAVTADNLAEVVTADGRLLLVGCGPRFVPPPPVLVAAMRGRGIGVEWMDTGAACRTLNVLVAEGRTVVAALIAVD